MANESKRLKCSNCNIVICEVLAFVQNKIDVMTEVSLVQICESAFSSDEIEVAKSLLFESVGKRLKTRKRQGKTLRNIEDIICLFKETDPEQVPIFVAKNLEKLPPVTFDHVDVTPLLKKIVLLEKAVHDIPHYYVSKRELKDHIDNMIGHFSENSLITREQNINNKMGGGLNNAGDSGPTAISTSGNSLPIIDEVNNDKGSSLLHNLINKSMHSCHSSPVNEIGTNEMQLPACGSAGAGSESETAGERILRCSSSNDTDNAVQAVLTTVNETAVERTGGGLVNVIVSDKKESITNNALSPPKHVSFSEVLQREGEWEVPEKSEAWHLDAVGAAAAL
ncbi:unnamed protein product [Arctia plantaginis]|uniref:Uncharacterized protein n=1 Tax=Arctia plantaginis TaxID=874455 RepID=A0A8S1BHF8_ARCPL|nr:unnamed protein product [Arctia plantaginis]